MTRGSLRRIPLRLATNQLVRVADCGHLDRDVHEHERRELARGCCSNVERCFYKWADQSDHTEDHDCTVTTQATGHPCDDDAYHRRALAALGAEVAPYEVEADADARGLLARAQAEGRLVAVHLEVLRDEPMTLGRVLELRKRRFVIHYLGRDGEWAREPERWRYRDVTRIEVGGRYLEALERFGDPYPTD